MGEIKAGAAVVTRVVGLDDIAVVVHHEAIADVAFCAVVRQDVEVATDEKSGLARAGFVVAQGCRTPSGPARALEDAERPPSSETATTGGPWRAQRPPR